MHRPYQHGLAVLERVRVAVLVDGAHTEPVCWNGQKDGTQVAGNPLPEVLRDSRNLLLIFLSCVLPVLVPLDESPGEEGVLLAPAARQPTALLPVHPLHLIQKESCIVFQPVRN